MVVLERMEGDSYLFKELNNDGKMLKISPYDCIGCGLCIPECPNEALFLAEDTPENLESDILGEMITLDKHLCTLQGPCAAICPKEAIELLDCSSDLDGMGYTPVSEQISITAGTTGTETRTKQYRWTIVKSAFSIWGFDSFETGTHKKVKVENEYKWQWVSLEHKEIVKWGLMAGGEASIKVISTTPTIGLYYAMMAIECSGTASIVCKGSPMSTSGIFTSTSIWHVDA